MAAIVAAVATFKPSTMAATSLAMEELHDKGVARRRSCATEKCTAAKELCDGWRLKDNGVADSLVDNV